MGRQIQKADRNIAAADGHAPDWPELGAVQQFPERTFRQSKDSIEKAVKKLQPSMAGRLPVVEGFVANADRAA